jgi:putative hydrolase of the HAD superfamily
MRFAAALFDLDDTLHDDSLAYHRAARAAADDGARECGVDAELLHRSYVARAERFWHELSARTLGTKLVALRASMWTGALADCGVDDPELGSRLAVAYNRYRAEVLELWPGVLEMLARLRATGMKLGIVTNGFSETHREKIVLLGLEHAVDGTFIADEIGRVKPDPEFFFHAARELGVDARACAVIGDRYDRDISGAHAAGMFAIWLDVRAAGVPPGARAPHVVVRRIGEVEAVLLDDRRAIRSTKEKN